MIILLNLLIAIMGDKYDEVQDNVSAERNYGLAKLILEYEAVIDQSTKKKFESVWYPEFIQVLQSKFKANESTEDAWMGKLHVIRQMVVSANEEQSGKLKKLEQKMDVQLKSLNDKVDGLVSKIEALLSSTAIADRRVNIS